MREFSHAYIPAIDGLRAIAVLAVIIFHVDFLDFLPGGFTGVDLFFVISGYVISQSLSLRGNADFADFLMDFYRRRLLRILPALLVVLLVSFLVSALFMPQFWLSEQMSRTGLAAFFGVSNVALAWTTDTYFAPGNHLNPYVQTWSLGVEEQFYLIFPALYFIWLRYRKRIAMVWAVLPLLAIASLAVSAVETKTDQLAAFYLLPGRFWELAVGAMLFQVVGAQCGLMRSRALADGLLACGFALLVSVFLLAGGNAFPFPWAIITVCGAALMIAAVVLPAEGYGSIFQSILQVPLLTYIGRLSYSLYLWHWPVLVLLRWTVGTELLIVQWLYPVVVWGLAASTYRWIEMPLRAGRSFWQNRAWATVALSISSICFAGWGAYWMSQNAERLSLSQTRDTYNWYAYKHDPQEPFARIEAPRVLGRQLFVIGDSHSAAYRTLLNLASLRLGIKVIEYEQGGCGVVSLMAADPIECAARRVVDFKDIETRAKPGDIVFLASLRMPELEGRGWERGTEVVLSEILSEQTLDLSHAARHSAEAVITRLQAAGVTVLIDAPKPLFKAPANRCSDWFNHMNPICAAGLTINRDLLERLRAPQMRQLEQLQREYPSLIVWDPFPLLCPGSVCSAYDTRGQPLFFDSNHLSGHGNRVLESSFVQLLLRIWNKPYARFFASIHCDMY
ncbi:acyltransferase family protein [Pseudomonas sp. CCC3.1]|uniref:acyltransferase family protein n=1 Tax=Pseudomonas sp. CCC3.1 TaxID=3048607 RepID=UPI002AC9D41B|nr:acyltransferase family protein [Pseudomonas sp. CCC3.1]MEB0206553.1 acyltransferase family protein [Pseudomonas sp. CCC3.1]WPX38972.1 acyltransferase family protein [Pseudomonas sp. CCC3.1]